MIDPEPVAEYEPVLFTLQRIRKREDGAYGVLIYGDLPFAVTLERTYTVDGTEWVKIPPGKYHCKRTHYIKGNYATYEVMVKGHSRILIHKGNVELDADGCILVAESFGKLRGANAILDSAGGFREFMELAGSRGSFVLEVLDEVSHGAVSRQYLVPSAHDRADEEHPSS